MRRRSSIAANPVLIGAATILVVVVAVFLAYNANSGLPFVPTYALKVDVPSAANLVRGNDVRIGGSRVGVVDSIDARRHADGSVTAELGLKLETSIKPLPMDSTVLIRPRSALGLKYVEITKGHAAQGFADGATVPISRATPKPVEIDEFLQTFNERVRTASRVNLYEFGNALAGRGPDLNLAIENLNPLLTNLVPLMRNLGDPKTQLGRFFTALGHTAALVAPVAETQASLFDNLDTTFTAFASVARPYIQDSITGGPPSLDAAIHGFPLQRPFLRNTQLLFHELRPGVAALRTAAPDLADAFTVGQRTLTRSIAFNRRLKPVFVSLQNFSQDPLVELGVRDLNYTASILNPTVANLAPAQTVCNYLSLWFRNVASLLSEGDSNGTWQRFIIIATPSGPNNEGGQSSAPANGPGVDNHLHTDPYPYTASPGQPRTCEAANEPYAVGQTIIGHAPGAKGTAHDVTTIGKDHG